MITTLREIPTVEFLYLSDDNFKKDINNLRRAYGIRFEEDGSITAESIVSFDNKLATRNTFRANYFSSLGKICKKYKIRGLIEDLEMFVETGETPYELTRELLTMCMTDSVNPSVRR